MVFMCHLFPARPGANWYLNPMGYNGVVLFYTLSGFVITLNYFPRLDEAYWPALWPYLKARFARIYPLHFVLLVTALALGFYPNTGALPLHFTLTQAWSGQENLILRYNGVAWSLSVEFFLYACFPFLVFPLLRLFRKAPGLLFITGVLIYLLLVSYCIANQNQAISAIYFYPVPHLCEFILGGVAAMFYSLRSRSSLPPAKSRIPALPYLLLVAIFGLALLLMSRSDFVRFGNLSGPLYAILIFILARYPVRLLSSRVMVALGEASFAFYLAHFMVIDSLRPRLLPDYDNLPVALSACAALFLLVLALSLLLHACVERPVRRWLLLAPAPATKPALSDYPTWLHWPDCR